MLNLSHIEKEKTGLLLIDLQEKLLSKIPNHKNLISNVIFLIKGLSIFKIPIIISQQYPQGLGPLSESLKNCIYEELKVSPPCFSKLSFSCLLDDSIHKTICSLPCTTWILAGIETHICLFQTAKDLLLLGKKVIVPRDTTSSRVDFEHLSAIEELRTLGARITTSETLLFEILKSKSQSEFKFISELVKNR